MADVKSILAELASKGKESYRKTYARHGLPVDRCYGVSNGDLKLIAKAIKGQQALALELYASGIVDAMYLAGLVADGRKMSRDDLQSWVEGAAGMPMIFDFTVPFVAVESPFGRELAMEWIGSPEEHVAAAGWCTYAGLVTTLPDDRLDLSEIEGLLERVVAQVHSAQNRVRAPMNDFVSSVAIYVAPLRDKANSAAKRIGAISVDVGDTACEVKTATAVIAKAEAAGKLGVKRKTIRC